MIAASDSRVSLSLEKREILVGEELEGIVTVSQDARYTGLATVNGGSGSAEEVGAGESRKRSITFNEPGQYGVMAEAVFEDGEEAVHSDPVVVKVTKLGDAKASITLEENEIKQGDHFTLQVDANEGVHAISNLIMVNMETDEAIYLSSEWEGDKIIGSSFSCTPGRYRLYCYMDGKIGYTSNVTNSVYLTVTENEEIPQDTISVQLSSEEALVNEEIQIDTYAPGASSIRYQIKTDDNEWEYVSRSTLNLYCDRAGTITLTIQAYDADDQPIYEAMTKTVKVTALDSVSLKEELPSELFIADGEGISLTIPKPEHSISWEVRADVYDQDWEMLPCSRGFEILDEDYQLQWNAEELETARYMNLSIYASGESGYSSNYFYPRIELVKIAENHTVAIAALEEPIVLDEASLFSIITEADVTDVELYVDDRTESRWSGLSQQELACINIYLNAKKGTHTLRVRASYDGGDSWVYSDPITVEIISLGTITAEVKVDAEVYAYGDTLTATIVSSNRLENVYLDQMIAVNTATGQESIVNSSQVRGADYSYSTFVLRPGTYSVQFEVGPIFGYEGSLTEPVTIEITETEEVQLGEIVIRQKADTIVSSRGFRLDVSAFGASRIEVETDTWFVETDDGEANTFNLWFSWPGEHS